MKLTRTQLAGLAVALAVVCLGKHVYRDASADELRAFLAPTAHATNALTGADFTFESGQGYIDREVGIIIEPGCAGVNFALAAFLALSVGWLARMRTARQTATRLAAAAALAYAATIVVNTLRIVVAIRLHGTHVAGLEPAEAHELMGIAVYLGGLVGLYALANGKWLAVPLAAYVVITLALPLAHGAAGRAGFVRHAGFVLAGCAVAGGIAFVVRRIRNTQEPSHVGVRT